MKTILDKLTDEQAKKELGPYTLWGAALSGISLIVFWFLGIAGLALASRALLLTWHKGNKNQKDIFWYRAAAIFAVTAGLVSIGYGVSQ